MTEVEAILISLEKTPVVLKGLLSQIPDSLYKERRIANKWSISEQVCHLVDAQSILMERFKLFETEDEPHIKAHDPQADAMDRYAAMDMTPELAKFPVIRNEMLELFRSFPENYWDKTGSHDEFTIYNTRILLGHTLNADYAHLFSIEQLGLTKAGREQNIITIP